jgi:DNA polymerase III subunit epsilon
MTREIVLDTETTGLVPADGHRIVEIGCIELINHVPTGQHWQQYFNPERDMPEEAQQVHGLDDRFLAEKPLFADAVEAFLEFIDEDTLIIHNADFDIGFLDAELKRIGRPNLTNPVIDTVRLARKVNPGARASLDALCKLYGIDNSKRTLHGALLDSQILADVYLELIGGRQVAMALSSAGEAGSAGGGDGSGNRNRAGQRPTALPQRLDSDAKKAHEAFIESLGDKSIWSKYGD